MTRRLLFMLSVLSVVSVALSVALVAQGAPDRSKPPAIGAPPRLNLPEIQKRMLSNGLAVWLVESHEVPLVQINLLLKAGASDDPAGKFGLASLTAAMLDEGAGARSSLEQSNWSRSLARSSELPFARRRSSDGLTQGGSQGAEVELNRQGDRKRDPSAATALRAGGERGAGFQSCVSATDVYPAQRPHGLR